MVFTLIAVGTTIYAISQAENKPQAIAQLGAEFAIAALVFKVAGGGTVGFVAAGAIGMYSDSPELNRQHAQEQQKDSIARDFILKRVPQAAQRTWYGGYRFDPAVLDQAKQLLFETKPIELETP
jgi:hypothetical protein